MTKLKLSIMEKSNTLTISSLLDFQNQINKLTFYPYETLDCVKGCIEDLIKIHNTSHYGLEQSLSKCYSAIYELMDRWGSYIDSKYHTLKGNRNSRPTAQIDITAQDYIEDLHYVVNPQEEELIDKNIMAFFNSSTNEKK